MAHPTDEHRSVVTTDEARTGTETGRVRWILGVSTALAVLAMAIFAFGWI